MIHERSVASKGFKGASLYSTSLALLHPEASHLPIPFQIVVRPPLVASLLLVAMPGAPSSVLAPSSDARSP